MDQQIIHPVVGQNVYIAPTAYVGGQVTLGDDTTVMHHVVIRADVSAVTIGRRVNIQDGTIIHTKTGVPLEIGDDVSIGHRAVVHCRRVGRGALIGIGAIILDDSEIGEGAIVAAGALVPPGTFVLPGRVAVGVPAKMKREVSEDDRRYMTAVSQRYAELGRRHASGVYPCAVGTTGERE